MGGATTIKPDIQPHLHMPAMPLRSQKIDFIEMKKELASDMIPHKTVGEIRKKFDDLSLGELVVSRHNSSCRGQWRLRAERNGRYRNRIRDECANRHHPGARIMDTFQ